MIDETTEDRLIREFLEASSYSIGDRVIFTDHLDYIDRMSGADREPGWTPIVGNTGEIEAVEVEVWDGGCSESGPKLCACASFRVRLHLENSRGATVVVDPDESCLPAGAAMMSTSDGLGS